MKKVICGNSAKVLKQYPDDHFDSVVTDPPYGIGFLGKAWDKDTGGLDVWKQTYRVLKPGGHLLAFSAARTYHRLATIVEAAGFEIRDQVIWAYSQGFPKAHDVGKAYDKRVAPHVEFLNRLRLLETKDIVEVNPYHGWKTSLKPGHEPIVMARKPFNESVLDNVLKNGTGALNIDRCRVPGEPLTYPSGGINRLTFNQSEPDRWEGGLVAGHADGRYPHNVIGEVEGHQKFFYCPKPSKAERNFGCEKLPSRPFVTNRPYGGGHGARKASNAAGSKNNHPTVKPVDLM